MKSSYDVQFKLYPEKSGASFEETETAIDVLCSPTYSIKISFYSCREIGERDLFDLYFQRDNVEARIINFAATKCNH